MTMETFIVQNKEYTAELRSKTENNVERTIIVVDFGRGTPQPDTTAVINKLIDSATQFELQARQPSKPKGLSSHFEEIFGDLK